MLSANKLWLPFRSEMSAAKQSHATLWAVWRNEGKEPSGHTEPKEICGGWPPTAIPDRDAPTGWVAGHKAKRSTSTLRGPFRFEQKTPRPRAYSVWTYRTQHLRPTLLSPLRALLHQGWHHPKTVRRPVARPRRQRRHWPLRRAATRRGKWK
jgi:hypothetical protein